MKNIFESPLVLRLGAVASTFLLAAGCATNDCQTTVRGTQVRSVVGNDTSIWKGSEVMSTTCRYQGNTDPTKFKAPGHLEHMNTPRTQPQQQGQSTVLIPWQ